MKKIGLQKKNVLGEVTQLTHNYISTVTNEFR
jgi:hypothetical protein